MRIKFNFCTWLFIIIILFLILLCKKTGCQDWSKTNKIADELIGLK